MHHSSRRRRRVLAAVTATVLALTLSALSGCSDPAAKSGGKSDTAQPPTRKELEKIVLKATDLPSGWKGRPAHASSSGDAFREAAQLACMGLTATTTKRYTAAEVAHAHSADFDRADATISASATSYKTQADVDANVKLLLGPKFSPCFAKALKSGFATEFAGQVSAVRTSYKITPGPAGGPENIVATGSGTFSYTAAGKRFTAYMSNAFITGPLVLVSVDGLNLNNRVPVGAMQKAIDRVATRAAKA